MLPAPSTATPLGLFSWAAVAGPPSPLNPASPVPAAVLMTPAESTLRIRWLAVSAMKRLPAPSAATPLGNLSRAEVAGPLSPTSREPANVSIL